MFWYIPSLCFTKCVHARKNTFFILQSDGDFERLTHPKAHSPADVFHGIEWTAGVLNWNAHDWKWIELCQTVAIRLLLDTSTHGEEKSNSTGLHGGMSYSLRARVKLQLHDAIYRLRFYSNSLTHILSFSNLHNNAASIQKNRGDSRTV